MELESEGTWEIRSRKLCVCALRAATVCTALAAQERSAAGRPRARRRIRARFNRQDESLRGRVTRASCRATSRSKPTSRSRPASTSSRRSEWRFKGHVKITVDTAVLEADSAVFTFDEQAALARRARRRARVVHRTESRAARSRCAAARASSSYDYMARTLRLSDDAWVQQGPDTRSRAAI